jgi:histone H3/H4
VKKIMKSEEIIMQELERERLRRESAEGGVDNQERSNVKFMISGEAPVLMSKACELLIKDLSFRAWQHTERNRRRTLQRQDLHAAVGESEVYDFLIDIVPRVQAAQAQAPPAATAPPMGGPDMSMMQASLPPGFQVPQIAQVTANLNQASMHHAHVMAAAVPVGAPLQATQPSPAPGLDNSTNAPAGMIQYGQGVPTDALNHLVHPWDPTQMTFAQIPPDGSEGAPAPNPLPGSAPAPPPTHQHHAQHQQAEQQQQQQQQAHHQPQQTQQQQPQMQAPQQLNHQQQWMDPSSMASMGAAPSNQQAPGV